MVCFVNCFSVAVESDAYDEDVPDDCSGDENEERKLPNKCEYSMNGKSYVTIFRVVQHFLLINYITL